MSHSITTEPKDTLNEQNTANEQNNNPFGDLDKQIIQRSNYKGLQIVKIMADEETKSPERNFVALGGYRLTEYFDTENELKEYLENKPFEMMILLAANITEQMWKELEKK